VATLTGSASLHAAPHPSRKASLDEVLAFRERVHEETERLLATSIDEESSRRIVLGLNHEQQHQELAIYTIGGCNMLSATNSRQLNPMGRGRLYN
jgi:hypothetical protein